MRRSIRNFRTVVQLPLDSCSFFPIHSPIVVHSYAVMPDKPICNVHCRIVSVTPTPQPLLLLLVLLQPLCISESYPMEQKRHIGNHCQPVRINRSSLIMGSHTPMTCSIGPADYGLRFRIKSITALSASCPLFLLDCSPPKSLLSCPLPFHSNPSPDPS